jgi:hypothetical protein
MADEPISGLKIFKQGEGGSREVETGGGGTKAGKQAFGADEQQS